MSVIQLVVPTWLMAYVLYRYQRARAAKPRCWCGATEGLRPLGKDNRLVCYSCLNGGNRAAIYGSDNSGSDV